MKVVTIIDHENELLIGYHVSDRLFDEISKLMNEHPELDPTATLQVAEEACGEQANRVYTYHGGLIID